LRNYNITTEKINKICTRCGIEKPLTLEYFKKDRTMKNGLSSRCKECDSIIKHEKYCKEHEEEIKTKEERERKNLKVCTHCEEELTATTENFHRNKNNKDGLEFWCKSCKANYLKEYGQKNIVKIREYQKKWGMENEEKVKVKRKIYELKNVEHIKEQWQIYSNKNKNNIKAYRDKNKEVNSKYNKQYRKEHHEELKEQYKEYYNNHKEIYHLSNQKRKAIKRKLPNTLTMQQWEKIKSDFNNKCAYCGEEKPLAQEHFIALSKGGEYTVNNIIPVCKSCNSSKRDRNFFEWYHKQDFYNKTKESFVLKYLGYKKEAQQLKII